MGVVDDINLISIIQLIGLIALSCFLMQACALGETSEQNDQDKVDLMNKQILSESKKTDTSSYKGQPSSYMANTDSFLKEAANNGFYLLSISEYLSKSSQDNNWGIVDARPAQLYSAGHIPEALGIPLESLISQMGMIPAGRKVAVYCTTDANAAFAVETLRVYADREAFVLSGGIDAWKADGMPVVS